MRRTRSVLVVPVAAAAVLLAAGCGSGGSAGATATSTSTTATESNPVGDIPDNQVYVPFTAADGAFTVVVPEGWSRAELPGGASYTDKLNTVSVQERTGQPQPTTDTVRGSELKDIAAAGTNVTVGTVDSRTLPAGDAVHATYSQDSKPDPVTGRVVRDDVELYVFWRNGTEVLLTLSGPHGADNVDPWNKISSSFTWK